MWTVTKLLIWTKDYFETHQVDSPRLTAELLLAEILRVSRLELYLRYDTPLSKDELSVFKQLIRRRVSGEPVQYILGKGSFMGMAFHVDKRVLIPRPETELLVEKVVNWFRCGWKMEDGRWKRRGAFYAPNEKSGVEETSIIDIGTGSGCLAVSLAKFLPETTVVATDISEDALQVAQANADHHGVRVTFHQGDFLLPLDHHLFKPVFIVSNPPYVSEQEWPLLQKEVRDHEPHLALVAKDNGLYCYQKILEQSHSLQVEGLTFEVGQGQSDAVEALIQNHYPDFVIDTFSDLNNIPRVVFASKV